MAPLACLTTRALPCWAMIPVDRLSRDRVEPSASWRMAPVLPGAISYLYITGAALATGWFLGCRRVMVDASRMRIAAAAAVQRPMLMRRCCGGWACVWAWMLASILWRCAGLV